MSWEGQKSDAAALGGEIPQESIRLRILAHSDRAGDQVTKRIVRDAVVEQMNGWVEQLADPLSLEEARDLIRGNLGLIEETVARTLKRNGKSYSYHVELGTVPFPTKMYGGAVYPAGDYEALRITLGAGEGKNWWCVLFPPLCFVDAGSGEALAKDGAGVKNTATVSVAGSDGEALQGQVHVQAEQGKAEVRFFLWDLLTSLWDWIMSLFK
ncbi:Stage II sporulation protein R [compost metagenome]